MWLYSRRFAVYSASFSAAVGVCSRVGGYDCTAGGDSLRQLKCVECSAIKLERVRVNGCRTRKSEIY